MPSFSPFPLAETHPWVPVAPLASVPAGIGLTGLGLISGALIAYVLRRRGLRWTWASAALIPALELWSAFGWRAIILPAAALSAGRYGSRWHRSDVQSGGDLARAAASRFGPLDAARVGLVALALRRAQWLTPAGLLVGHDGHGRPAYVPIGDAHGGSHTLVLGVTGSGKTVTLTWMAVRAIGAGRSTIIVDPKGDEFLLGQCRAAAENAGRRFIEWSVGGPAVYNPFAGGTDTEIADKALAGEHYTEPHYLRQAQRYLGHEVRVLRQAGMAVSLSALVTYLDPSRLEVLTRTLPESAARGTFDYLDSLTARQVRDLSGTRDRLAVLAESDAGRWLDPGTPGAEVFDLLEAITEGAVVYFGLDADRRPLLAQMLGAAIVQDLVTVSVAMQGREIPSLVVIDEFAALAAQQVGRLFGRARSAGMSLVLATQEISDLSLSERPGLLEQILGNIGALVAHRQIVPDSIELVAGVAGSRGSWSSSHRDDGGRTRTRKQENVLDSETIRTLPRGVAAVMVTGAAGPDSVRVVRVLLPTA